MLTISSTNSFSHSFLRCFALTYETVSYEVKDRVAVVIPEVLECQERATKPVDLRAAARRGAAGKGAYRRCCRFHYVLGPAGIDLDEESSSF